MTARAPTADLVSPDLQLPDGSSVRPRGRGAEIVDPSGHVVVRYEAGRATIVAATGDLHLAAPEGSVVVKARDGVTLETEGTMRQIAGELEVRARVGRAALGLASVFTRSLEVTGTHAVQRFERYETDAVRIVQTAREIYRDAQDLVETRAGRLRMVVEGLTDLSSRRTAINSDEDTSIDGRRVLLG